MSKFVQLSSATEWSKHLEEFNWKDQTWIVADLRSKFEVQQILFSKTKILPEVSVLRASELWQLLFKSKFPEHKIVSPSYVQSLCTFWLSKEEQSWLKTPGVSSSLVAYLDHLAPCLVHEDAHDHIENWLNSRSSALVRWGKWYYLAQAYFQKLDALKVVLPNWIPAFLVNNTDNQFTWPRDLIFDLGGQLNPSEILLVQELSKKTKVKILCPQAEALRNLDCMQETYSLLLGKTNSDSVEIKPAPQKTKNDSAHIRKFATMLAEVKDVCGQVREWADHGVALDKIAIVSPDIELYWPFLYAYLKREGLFAQKKYLTRAHSLPKVSLWLSRLRLELNEVSTSDLESIVFGDADQLPILKYDEFKKIFTNIFNSKDLERTKKLKHFFDFKMKSDQVLEVYEFLAWAVGLWPDSETAVILETIVKNLLKEVGPRVPMRACDWIKCLTSIASKMEVANEQIAVQGVFCEKISSTRYLDVERLYVIGLTQSNFDRKSKTAISADDVRQLRQDLGFYLNNPDHNVEEEELIWLMQDKTFEKIISTSITNFSGQAETSAVYWIEYALQYGRDPEHIDLPKTTLWDRQQQLVVHHGDQSYLDEKRNTKIKQFVDRDRGEAPFAEFEPAELNSLSVSSLKSYAKCPFIFSASKLFNLSDLPAIDIDIDRMTKGKFGHSLFEYLTQEPIKYDYSNEELAKIIEECRIKEKVMLASPQHWSVVSENYIELCKNFLAFEKSWRQRFPKTHTTGREIELSADWSLSQNTFVSQGEGDIKFRGFIDRVDTDSSGHAVVIDYKSSASQASNYGSWVKNHELQMAVYSYLLSQGHSALGKLDVWAACYYVMKNFERNKGFWLKDIGTDLYDLPKSARNDLDFEGLEQFYSEVLSAVGLGIQNILKGNFAPNPEDRKTCPDCRWRKMCRAPHLN